MVDINGLCVSALIFSSIVETFRRILNLTNVAANTVDMRSVLTNRIINVLLLPLKVLTRNGRQLEIQV